MIILVFSDVLNDTTNVKKETDSHLKKIISASNGDLSLATLTASFVILVLHYVYIKTVIRWKKKSAFLIKTDANLSKTVSDSPVHVSQTIYNRLIKSETLSVFLFFSLKETQIQWLMSLCWFLFIICNFDFFGDGI